ncbi:MAG: non-canonical purine NTP diphosphatase [Bacteroidetes bacterium]|nr:non-canonical purine NTP diphosphatase [Bacteroidota bacterium]
MELVFATNNKYKIEEVQHLLKNGFNLLCLKDIGCDEELPETGNTLEKNAKQKARYVYKKYKADCFADDTGLEIESLNGKPGVLSARYAGEEKNSEKNIEKVLEEMKNTSNRYASFITVILLIIRNKEYLFKGKVDGIILTKRQGQKGFGYDPIFIPNGYNKSFAEMSLEEKSRISHRAIAVKKLAKFLNELKR